MRIVGWLLFLGALGSWAVTSLSQAGGSPRTAAVATRAGIDSPPGQLASASCAAASCHGSGKLGHTGGEYSTWAPTLLDEGPTDPHSKAYRILFNDDSVRIARLLGLSPPHREPRCLKCHATPGVRPGLAISEGVGCGSCHGPAEQWIALHHLPSWKAVPERERWERYGFMPTKNATARILECAGCHVGDATREVNHDMIAAGHPRLAFEAARWHFHPSYRTHWTEKTPQPEFEVRAWIIGQAVTLRAATDLLRVRAERAVADAPGSVWPEFAGYSCYSCHHAIDPGFYLPGEAGPQPTGQPRWETWSTSAVRIAAAYTARAFPGTATPSLEAVRALEKVMEDPDPKPELVRSRAAAAVAQLDAWVAFLQTAEECRRGVRNNRDLPGQLIRELARDALTPDRRALRESDWDFLAAHVLGCAAMSHATAGSEGGTEVRGLIDLLRFPPPIRDKQRRSPGALTREKSGQVRDLFQRLAESSSLPRSR
jgi:hypothetical protein